MADVSKALKIVRELNPLGLFSRATEAAASLPQAKGTPEQMRKMLVDSKGVKADELKYTGFDDWIKGKKSVTRDEMVEFLRRNQVQVGEERLGQKTVQQRKAELEAKGDNRSLREENELSDIYNGDWVAGDYPHDIKATKFDQYTLPGGENYREVLLTRPPMRNAADTYEKTVKGLQREIAALEDANPNWTPELEQRRQALFTQLDDANRSYIAAGKPEKSESYRSSHWDTPNVLAHLRMKDRVDPQGRRVLHLEELQSDWAQEGRKRGFKDTSQDWLKTHDEFRDKMVADWIEKKAAQAMEVNPELFGNADRAREVARMSARHYGARRIADEMGVGDEYGRLYDNMAKAQEGLPSAPFVTATDKWTDLALKRALREAAEGNYDAIAWTPGREQAKRYDLSKQIDRVYALPYEDGTYEIGTQLPGGREFLQASGRMSLEKIEKTFGKDIAARIKEGKFSGVDNNTPFLQGEDLRVGGEGMIGYYDKIVPKRLQELVRPLDPEAKFGTVNISAGDDTLAGRGISHAQFYTMTPEQRRAAIEASQPPLQSLPSLNLTPAMREKIKEGLPLFTMMPAAVGLGATASQMQEGENPAVEEQGFDKGGLVKRALEAVRGIRAYHSSPHDFDRFDLSKIGTGEGNQSYGHGLYVAESPKVSGQGGDYWRQFWNKMPSGPERSAATALFASKFDRDKAIDHLLRDIDYNAARGVPGKYGDGPVIEEGHRLLAQEGQQALDILRSGQIAGPRTYEVNINAHPEQFLDYDKTLAQQSDSVQKALRSIDIADESVWPKLTARDAYEMLRVDSMGDDAFLRDQAYRLARRAEAGAGASQTLREAGIPGIKYFDAGSRDAGEGTRNYVVFDDKLIDILKKYGLPTMAAGAGAASMPETVTASQMQEGENPAVEEQGFDKGGLVKRALQAVRGIRAYHASPKDFDIFKPSEFRGASFFASTPERAKAGAGAGANEMIMETSTVLPPTKMRTYEVEINPTKILGLHLTPAEQEWIKSSPARIVGDDALEQAMKERPNPYIDWETIYSPNKIGDRLYEYVKRDELPFISYEDAIRTGRDVYGRQHSHYGAGADEKAAARHVLDQGMGGYLVNDEAGLSIAVADPSIVQILRKYGLPMMAAGAGAASMPDSAPAAPSDVDAALDVARRASGGRLLIDQYPTHYLPDVGRQVMQDGGAAADDAYLDALLEASRPNADIRAYETRMREIASQPADIRSMTHAPNKPMRPIEIEGGFIGKRELGQAPYDVAGPLSGMAQAAYSMKTLPFYFTPAMPIAAASDIGEAAIDTKNALEKGDYLSAGLSGVLGVGAGAFPFRKQIGSAVGRAVDTARDVLGRVPAPVAAGAAGAAAMTPEEAEAAAVPKFITKSGRTFLQFPAGVPAETTRHGISGKGKLLLPQPLEKYIAELTPNNNIAPRQTIDWEKLKGGVAVPALWDRTIGGYTLHSFGPHKLITPKELQGGNAYQRWGHLQPDQPAGASGADVIARYVKKTQDAAKEGQPYLVTSAMGPEGGDFSSMMYSPILDVFRQNRGKIDNALVAELDQGIRNKLYSDTRILMGDDRARAYASKWPGMDHPDIDALLASMPGPYRSTMAKVMDKAKYRKGNMPDISALRFATTDPDLLHAPSLSTGYSVAKLDPRGVAVASGHNDYDTAIRGLGYLGGARTHIPWNVFWRDFAATRPAGENFAHTQKAFLTQMPLQKIDDRLIDTIKKYEEEAVRRGNPFGND